MSDQNAHKDVFANGAAYEPYVGRWSRLVAQEFLQWLDVPAEKRWLDVGCGTGALSQTILRINAPASIKGIDFSAGFVAFAQSQINDGRVSFEVGDAQALTVATGSFDAAVSGLMLNFVAQPQLAVNELARAVQPGGTIGIYIWDYASKMQMMRHFWNAAAALDPQAYERDEGRRFPICNPAGLTELFESAKLHDIEVRAIDISTDFKDFDDYWLPFLGGQGSAPTYTASLSESQREALRERIRIGLPFAIDGSIPLVARAWAVRGRR